MDLNDVLVTTNKRLLDELLEMEACLERARTCADVAGCPLCMRDMCAMHKEIARLSARPSNAKISALERQLIDAKEQLSIINDQLAAARRTIEQIPSLLVETREQAAAGYAAFVERDRLHIEFIAKVAARLGIETDGPIERLQSRVDDSIRKLLS